MTTHQIEGRELMLSKLNFWLLRKGVILIVIGVAITALIYTGAVSLIAALIAEVFVIVAYAVTVVSLVLGVVVSCVALFGDRDS